MRRSLACAFAVLLLAITLSAAQTASAVIQGSPCGDDALGCSAGQAGLDVNSTLDAWLHQPRYPGDTGKALVDNIAAGPRYEYTSSSACTLASVFHEGV